MNSIAKIYCIILFLLFSITTPDACTLDGRWYDPTGRIAPWTFVQDNTMFTGIMDQTKPDKCGAIYASGTVNTMSIFTSVYYGPDNASDCEWNVKATGTFTEDCYSMLGTWSDSNGNSGSYQLNRVPIIILEPKTDNDLIITAEPKMPEFKALATVDQNNPYVPNLLQANPLPYTWHLVIDNEPIPGIRKFQMTLEDVATGKPKYEPDFNLLMSHEMVKGQEKVKPVDGGIVGGQLSLWVYYYKDSRNSNLYPASDLKIYTIKGTNPGQVAIETMLTDSMSRQIACQESRYKQFDAAREGGIGLPLIGKSQKGKSVGGTGIMQLFKPAPKVDKFWNWRNNITAGLNKISEDGQESKQLYVNEQKRLNIERAAKNLSPCPANIPYPLNSEQVMRDTIRRYNCGVEYRWEPRDSVNCEGQWVSEPSCIRLGFTGIDDHYVDHVLACNINE